MKPFYLILALLCTPAMVEAQRKLQLTLKDSTTQSPVAFATVSLYRINNAVKPAQQLISKENGKTEITITDTATYQLIITHTAYNELTLSLPDDSSLTVMLSPVNTGVNNVVVTGTRKVLIEKIDDKMVYNVEADVSMDGQMATDALRKTPFISVDGDGNVQLKGQSNFKILLNGKEAGIFARDPKEALKSFPASSIKKIEVISSPSAKYDAEGIGGIINIITRKAVYGYNATIGASYRNLRNTQYATLNVKYGKIGFTGSVSRGFGKNRDFTNTLVTEALIPSAYSKRTLNGSGNNQYQWHDGSVEISYDIDSLHTLSAYGNLGNNPFTRWQTRNVSLINTDYTDTSYSIFKETASYPYSYHDEGIDYIQKFSGKPNKEWTIKLNRQFSGSNSYVDNDQYSYAEQKLIRNNNQEKNTQYVFQSDFVLPLTGKQKLEMGGKAIVRSANATYESLYKDQNGKFITDAGNSDRFNYKQGVYGGYILYSRPLGLLQLKIGSRIERTVVNGKFAMASESLKQDYYNFLPSFYISRKIKEIHDISLSYNKRIRRPFIWDLNPFVNNTDTLNISYGNPNLKPEVTHVLSLSYSYFKNSNSLSVSLAQNLCNTQIIRYTLFDATSGITAMIPDNLGENRFTSLNLNANLKIFKIWSINLNTGIQYNQVKNRKNPAQQNKGFSGNGNLSNTIDITNKFSFFNSGGFWQSPIQLQGKLPFNYWYDAGIAYKFLNNKLRVTVRANNFLQEFMVYKRTFRDSGFSQESTNRFRQRTLDVSVKWNFGRLSESTSRKRGVKTDDIQK